MAETKVHKYRVLERSADLFTPDGHEGLEGTSGSGVSGAMRTKYKAVAGFIDHGVVDASSAHQARVAIFEKLGRDEETLIVVREENLLEDTLTKQQRFDIVSAAGKRRAESRKPSDARKEDEPPAE